MLRCETMVVPCAGIFFWWCPLIEGQNVCLFKNHRAHTQHVRWTTFYHSKKRTFCDFFAVILLIYPKINGKYGACCPQNDVSDEFLEGHKNKHQHSIVLKLRIRVYGTNSNKSQKTWPRAVESGRIRPLRRKHGFFQIFVWKIHNFPNHE